MNEPTSAGSCFADRAAAERALAMALPMIEPLMRDASVVGSGFLHIVVRRSGARRRTSARSTTPCCLSTRWATARGGTPTTHVRARQGAG